MMLWRMWQSGLQRFEATRRRNFLRNIWVSDGAFAARHLFSQNSSVYDDGTILITGKINLSSYLSDSKTLALSGRTSLMFRVGLQFENHFRSPPSVAITGNIQSLGIKQMHERRFLPQVANVTTQDCEVIVELVESQRALEGLHLNWTAIGLGSRNPFRAMQ